MFDMIHFKKHNQELPPKHCNMVGFDDQTYHHMRQCIILVEGVLLFRITLLPATVTTRIFKVFSRGSLWMKPQKLQYCYPRHSMDGIFTYIWLTCNMVNVGKYTVPYRLSFWVYFNVIVLFPTANCLDNSKHFNASTSPLRLKHPKTWNYDGCKPKNTVKPDKSGSSWKRMRI